eukprot:TRINITY_DN22064_c0_g1_i1.p1 TRINITY_DN22064_c0_g1~~TRINITY_DN22064_c0_g1_i1.p1  ORF type:complete len:633 (-),score=124.02 TRINITY_DN22064_c0_g1_i1:84-1901(-)
MAESAPSAGGRAGAARRGSAGEQAVGDLPIFCRPRHRLRGVGVYLVPLWDITSRWLPEEIVPRSAARSAAAGAPAAAAAGSRAINGVDPAGTNDDGVDSAVAGSLDADLEKEDDSGSESDQSDIAWDGPLGAETRQWKRAEVDGGLVLLRRVKASSSRGGDRMRRTAPSANGYPATTGDTATAADSTPDDASAAAAETPAAVSTYGLGVCSALFDANTLSVCNDAVLDDRLAEVLRTREPRWAVFALRSGHFAGAVFKGQEAIVHKAVHRYTVRAKAGGAQSSMDNTKGKPKSAGSSLRRYGETRLAEEIKELLTEKWATEIAGCELVFVSVSKRMRATLLGAERAPYLPNAQIRRLPFMVGRPTFEAIKEAHLKVASVAFMDNQTAESLSAKFRPAPVPVPAATTVVQASAPSKPAAQPEEPREKYCEEKDELYTALHAAAASGADDKIMELLDDGADPTARDGKGRVPYYLCAGQKTREVFRRWRGANEDAWDWQAAQIPEGITEETEQLKKDKEKEKNKKKKEKQKQAKAKAKEEDEERRQKEEEEKRALEAAQAKCDSCGKPIVEKPFTRLNYMYCTSVCVNNHRRELQAEAASKRLGLAA